MIGPPLPIALVGLPPYRPGTDDLPDVRHMGLAFPPHPYTWFNRQHRLSGGDEKGKGKGWARDRKRIGDQFSIGPCGKMKDTLALET